VPVYLSAVFAKGIALCGEVADGIILTRTLEDWLSRLLEMMLVKGARSWGRRWDKFAVDSPLEGAVRCELVSKGQFQ
jgi:hypothetical protein